MNYRRGLSVIPVMLLLLLYSCSQEKQTEPPVKALSGGVTVEFDSQRVPLIQAENLNDALITQGYLQARNFGKEIVHALAVFKGETSGLSGDHLLWAQLFHNMPLSEVAEQSVSLHRAETRQGMRAFVEGLKAGYPEFAWSETDLLILQRGYAFLYNDVLAQTWNSYCEKEQEGKHPHMFMIPTTMLPLFKGPVLEIVRDGMPGQTEKGAEIPFSQEFRASPDWWFVFQPVRITTPKVHVEGMALAGLPFLFSGTNTRIQFVQTPFSGDVACIFPMDREKADIIDALPPANKMADLVQGGVPLHMILMPRSNAAGSSSLVARFFWTGFRPSADLDSFYELLRVSTLENASYVHNHFQVPLVESILVAPSFPSLNLICGTQYITRESVRSGNYLFPFPGQAFFKVAQPNQVQAFSFERKRRSQAGTTDQRLAQLMTQWLRGPLKMTMPEGEWARAKTLFASPSLERRLVIQMLWRELLPASGLSWPSEYVLNQSVEVKESILSHFSRETSLEKDRSIRETVQILQKVISAILMDISNSKAPESLLAFYLPSEPKIYYNLPRAAPSMDNTNGLFYVGFQSEITRATTHRMIFNPQKEDHALVIRTLPFAVTGKPSSPKGSKWKEIASLELVPE